LSRRLTIATAGLLAAVVAACSSEPATATLKWRAASEIGVYGYLIYRAEDRAGPFQRVNETIVRVPADGASEHSYTYTDDDVVPGQTYFYYLDAVSTQGVKQRFSGILSKEGSSD
jgi:hypothetical protein